jgi:predicted amidophosphoribosyltransferase
VSLIDFLAPPACLACRAPGMTPLCPPCRRALPWLGGALCAACALPSPAGAACRRCPMAGSAVEGAWAPMAHAGPARALVHALKLRGARAAADVMGAQLAAGAPPGWLAGTVTLVPVPPQPLRARARGFDHAAVIAAALARRTGAPVDRCLARPLWSPRQAGAGRAARLAAAGTRVRRGTTPAVDCVLVDDVHTTGATLRACAAALRAAGADRVRAITYSRAIGSC